MHAHENRDMKVNKLYYKSVCSHAWASTRAHKHTTTHNNNNNNNTPTKREQQQHERERERGGGGLLVGWLLNVPAAC